MGLMGQVGRRQSRAAHVRFRSIADIAAGQYHFPSGGAGSALGVAPSISSLPPGWTMILRKVICTLPPSESDAASVWGRILARSPAYALEFSTASLVRYPVNPSSPP